MGILFGALVSVIILVPFALLNGAKLVILPLLPIGTFAAAAYIFYYYALEKGKLSLTATVQSTYPLYTVILATLFLGETLSALGKTGVFAIIIGMLFLSTESPKDLIKTKLGAWLWWGFAAAVLAGIGDFFGKVMVSIYNPYSYSLAFVIGWVSVTLVLLALDRKNISFKKLDKGVIYSLLGNIIIFIGYLFFYLAFQKGPASIVTPITGAYGLISFVLALIWLKEKISKYQILGAIISIIGVYFVSIL